MASAKQVMLAIPACPCRYCLFTLTECSLPLNPASWSFAASTGSGVSLVIWPLGAGDREERLLLPCAIACTDNSSVLLMQASSPYAGTLLPRLPLSLMERGKGASHRRPRARLRLTLPERRYACMHVINIHICSNAGQIPCA